MRTARRAPARVTVSAASRRAFSVPAGTLAFLASVWLLSVVTQSYVILPASVLPRIATALSVPEATAVWVVSAAPAGWGATNLAAGSLADRYGDVRVAVGATALVIAGAAASWRAGLAGAFVPLLAARALGGAGLGIVWTVSANLVGRTVPPRTQGTALGVFTTSAPVGFALAQVLGPPVADVVGWPALFALVAGLTAVALCLFLGSVRLIDLRAPAAAGITRADVASVVRSRGVAAGCAMAFAAYSLYLVFNSWMPTYLTRQFGLSLGASGLLAAAFPAVGVLSRAGGGVISDRLFGGDRVPVLKLSFLATAPAVAITAVATRLAVLVAVLVMAGFVIQLTFGVVYSYVRELVSERMAGTALSFLSTAGIAGAFSAPLIAGELISVTGTFAAGFAYAGALVVAGLALAWSAPESGGF